MAGNATVLVNKSKIIYIYMIDYGEVVGGLKIGGVVG